MIVGWLISDQHVLLAADEGIYTLNMNELHEGSMVLVSHAFWQSPNKHAQESPLSH